ncbi:MAG: N-acetylneuraminate synthase family protein [Planctomycetes bacterium]|nr:N-acetylneuraminate synthase family protein [Planctomycetota bacterium]
MSISPVRIGKHSVGDGETVYVIAEAGVNHDGSLETAFRLIDVAAEAGADAVKFQMFTASELVTSTAPTANYQRANGGPATQVELLRRLELSVGDFSAIADHCRCGGIDFLATPFSVPDLERLSGLAPNAIKLASTDLDNVPLQEAAAETGLPLIISTGAADEPEVAAAVGRLDRLGAFDRVILLHCVSCYPTP